LRSILVVEDDEKTRSFIELLLSYEGYTVRTAAHAGEARVQLFSFDPDLILMDLQLPELGGLEFTRQIKAHPDHSHIPILAITAFAQEFHRERALEAGCAGYIAKPFRAQALLDFVAAHLCAAN
jgi:two-component system, cell cycle response regulator DivK